MNFDSALLRAARHYAAPVQRFEGGIDRWDCCSFVAQVLIDAFGLDHTQGDDWGRAVNIRDAGQPWSGMEAVIQSPGGRLVDRPIPGRWHVCQRWTGHPALGGRGHTFFWRALTREEGHLLDSSAGRGPRYGGARLDGDPSRQRWAPTGETRVVVIDPEAVCPRP